MSTYIVSFLLFLGLIFGIYEYGVSKGYSQRDAETVQQIAKINAENQKKTEDLIQQRDEKESELQKEKNNAKKEIAKLNSDLVANKLQFYVKVKSPPNNACANASTPTGDQTNVAQLDSSTATALVNITSQGDEGIAKLNACVAFYNQIRSMVNGTPTTK